MMKKKKNKKIEKHLFNIQMGKQKKRTRELGVETHFIQSSHDRRRLFLVK